MPYPHFQPPGTVLIQGQPVRFRDVCVYEFTIGDVEDPDIMAGEPIWNWQQSAAGSWIMEHAQNTPYWIQNLDPSMWGTRYKIMARLSERDETFWRLKRGGPKS